MRAAAGRVHTADYLTLIGVAKLPSLTSPFDPGYDPATLASHLDQSAQLMANVIMSTVHAVIGLLWLAWVVRRRFRGPRRLGRV